MADEIEVTEAQQEPEKKRRKGKGEKKPRERSLSQVQLRTLAYIEKVGVTTREGLYHSGVSDSTGRTLNSLLDAGLVESDTPVLELLAGDRELFGVTDAGAAELESLRALVRSL